MRKLLAYLFIAFPMFAEHTILVDPHYSPYMGGNDLLFGEWGLTRLEDYWIPERSDSTLSIIGRGFEQLGWAALNLTTSTVQHEIFGHGYRLRELGITPKGYRIYLGGGGATYFNVPDSFLLGNMQAVVVAGLEAESILARIAKMNWMQKGSIDGRCAITYFQAQQSLFFYTLITNLAKIKDNTTLSSNDVEAYLNILNATYPNSKTTIGTLTRFAAFNWLDPMTFYSLFSWFYYMAEGREWDFPMISLTDSIKYLPNVKIGYAPYAPEAYLENFFTFNSNPLYLYFKGGKRSFGTGFSYEHLIEKTPLTLGLNFDAWAQRQYLSSSTIGDFSKGLPVAVPNTTVVGGALSLTSRIRVHNCLQLFLELGGKTAGYLPGYSLSGGLVVRGGLTICDF